MNDFEHIWKVRSSQIAHVYKLILAGCAHESIESYIKIKDSFLYAGHGLRGKLLRGEKIAESDEMLFKVADDELERAWSKVPEIVKRLV